MTQGSSGGNSSRKNWKKNLLQTKLKSSKKMSEKLNNAHVYLTFKEKETEPFKGGLKTST